MAHYTITIKTLLDNNFDFKMNDYPIFDENYRATLNRNILYHYYENEIGFETAALFRFYLNQKLNEIMPYYNTLYQKQDLLLNSIDSNVNLKESFDRTNKRNDTNNTSTNTKANSTSNSSGNSSSKNLFLDTPQGSEYKGTIDDTDYATNVTFDKNNTSNSINDESTSNGSSNATILSNTTDNYIKNVIGNNGGKYSLDILNDLKNNLMNIDLMIINDLNELFMQIF